MGGIADPLSSCCAAPVRAQGDVTRHWECTRCGRPCDAAPASSERRAAVETAFTEALAEHQGVFRRLRDL